MLVLPFKVNDREFDLFIALEDENIQRIREYDPGDIIKKSFQAPWNKLQIRNIIIGYANEQDKVILQNLHSVRNLKEMLAYLQRGWKFRPEAGDSEEPYERMGS